MSDLNRRAILGAASLGAAGALGGMARAGPLTPPGGAGGGGVAPTGRTLDDIYNHIPTGPGLGAYDGRTPIGGGPYTINAPGGYILFNDLAGTSDPVLTINASDVTVDLNGFTVGHLNQFGSGSAIGITGTRRNITIRNGTIEGGSNGLSDMPGSGGSVTALTIEDLKIVNTRFCGIALTRSESIVIRRCHLVGVGYLLQPGDPTSECIRVSARSGRIEDCNIHNHINPDGNVRTMRGIYQTNPAATGMLIARCHIGNPTVLTGTGINALAGSTVIRDCTVWGYSAGYNGGTGGGGNSG